MLIQCTSCQATYHLNVANLPNKRSFVRCKHCQAPIHLPTPEEAHDLENKPQFPEDKVQTQCPNCHTKYRVKAERIKGVKKFKCSHCGNVFAPNENQASQRIEAAVEAHPEAKESTLNVLEDFAEDSEAFTDLFHKPGESIERSDRKGKNKLEALRDEAEAKRGRSKGSSLADVGGEALEEPQKVAPKPKKDAERPVRSETPSSGKSTPAAVEDSVIGYHEFDEDEDEDESELMELSQLPEKESWKAPPSPPYNTEEADPLALPEDADASESREHEPPRRSRPLPVVDEDDDSSSWAKITTGLFVMLLGVAILLGIGGYLALKDDSILTEMLGTNRHKFEFVGKLNEQRVQNLGSRKVLFVINGTLLNEFDTSDEVSWIQLKGLAFDENQNLVETSNVYAGNVLTPEELANKSIDEIKTFLSYNSGRNNSNFHLEKGERVPFQIVFFNSESVLQKVSTNILSYVRNQEKVYVRSPDS